MTPLGAIVRGLCAGAAGTLAMDMLWFERYRREGGERSFREWELSSGLESWQDAPAPAQVGKRIVEGLFQRELPPERAALVSNVTHWAYGMAAGAQFGVAAGSLETAGVWYGIPFGAGVWASGYVVLPLMHLYKPIWEYGAKTLAKDLSAHLLYGLTTSATFRALASATGTGSS